MEITVDVEDRAEKADLGATKRRRDEGTTGLGTPPQSLSHPRPMTPPPAASGTRHGRDTHRLNDVRHAVRQTARERRGSALSSRSGRWRSGSALKHRDLLGGERSSSSWPGGLSLSPTASSFQVSSRKWGFRSVLDRLRSISSSGNAAVRFRRRRVRDRAGEPDGGNAAARVGRAEGAGARCQNARQRV